MFLFARPKYKIGMLVRITVGDRKNCMLIKNIRKVHPNGESMKQWVYDGVLIEIRRIDKEIEASEWTYISCVLESSIHSVIA